MLGSSSMKSAEKNIKPSIIRHNPTKIATYKGCISEYTPKTNEIIPNIKINAAATFDFVSGPKIIEIKPTNIITNDIK